MIPEDEAENLLEEVGMKELPIIPMEICRRLKIIYREQPLKGIDGMLLVDHRIPSALISVNISIGEQGRKNFTCAHELGHYCMDSYSQSEFRCSREDIESYRRQTKPIEAGADLFAAELLMPRSLFKGLVDSRDPDWDHIKELAKMSQTSLLSTALRFCNLTDHSCVLIVSKDSAVSWFCPSKTFKLYIDMDSRTLSPHTIAAHVFEGQHPSSGFEVVKADNWVSGPGITHGNEILEWTLPMNSYGQVYTLLFDEDGIGVTSEEDDKEDDHSVEWEPPTFHKSRRKG
jgi:Zn-dependent peptidase ImmA (M78 family)